MVHFGTPVSKTTGMTYDVSRDGMFVQTIRIPNIGEPLTVTLHLPDRRQVVVGGRVVRSFLAPGLLRSVMPSGFGLQVSQNLEEYDEFLSSLFAPEQTSDPA